MALHTTLYPELARQLIRLFLQHSAPTMQFGPPAVSFLQRSLDQHSHTKRLSEGATQLQCTWPASVKAQLSTWSRSRACKQTLSMCGDRLRAF